MYTVIDSKGATLYKGTHKQCVEYLERRKYFETNKVNIGVISRFKIKYCHGEPTLTPGKIKELWDRLSYIEEISKRPEPTHYWDKEVLEFFTCMLAGMSNKEQAKVLRKIYTMLRRE